MRESAVVGRGRGPRGPVTRSNNEMGSREISWFYCEILTMLWYRDIRAIKTLFKAKAIKSQINTIIHKDKNRFNSFLNTKQIKRCFCYAISINIHVGGHECYVVYVLVWYLSTFLLKILNICSSKCMQWKSIYRTDAMQLLEMELFYALWSLCLCISLVRCNVAQIGRRSRQRPDESH